MHGQQNIKKYDYFWEKNNITEQRTPWSRVHRRKPVTFQRIKNYPEIHGTLHFITMQDVGWP